MNDNTDEIFKPAETDALIAGYGRKPDAPKMEALREELHKARADMDREAAKSAAQEKSHGHERNA